VLAPSRFPSSAISIPKFFKIMDQSMAMLREVFQTKNSCPADVRHRQRGHGNLFCQLGRAPATPVLTVSTASSGTRMVDVRGSAAGARSIRWKAEWAQGIDAQKFKDALGQKKYYNSLRWYTRDFDWSLSRSTNIANWFVPAALCCC